MSGWIKWEKDLETDPRMIRMAREMKRLCNADALPAVTLVCGSLIRLWSYADSHIRDDNTLDLGASEIDDLLGIPGFCSIMPDDWLREVDEHTVELPDFQEHNGIEARKRALTQKRVTRHRDKAKRTSVTSALPDQDQTKTNTETSKRVAQPRPARQVPDSFAVTEDMRSWAQRECPGVNVDAETAKFRDHEFAKPRTDWLKAWRNWLRRSGEMGSSRVNGSARKSFAEQLAALDPDGEGARELGL